MMSFCEPGHISLRGHQRAVVALALAPKTAGVCVFHGTGTGKTLTASAVARCMLSRRLSSVKCAVVVTRSAVVAQFEEVIVAFLRDDPQYAKAAEKREKTALRDALRTAPPPPDMLPSCSLGGSGKRAPLFFGRTAETEEHRRVIDMAPPVPPAYTGVYYCHPKSRLAWTARDAKGRSQSRYRDGHAVRQRSRRNLRVMLELNPAMLARYDDQLANDIVAGKSTALVALLVRDCALRLMHRRNDDGEDGHFGLTTLLAKHVLVSGGGMVSLAFRGKSGKHNACDLASTTIGQRAAHKALVIRVRSMSPGERVFSVSAVTVNDYIADTARHVGYAGDQRLTAKDFRTYEANRAFVQATISSDGTPKRKAHAGFRAAAAQLNNTPAVAQKSYVSAALANFSVAMPQTYARLASQAEPLPAIMRALLSLAPSDSKMEVLDAMPLAAAAAMGVRQSAIPVRVGTHAEVVGLGPEALKGSLLVIDEAHGYANDTAMRSDMMRSSGLAAMTMCMTATPVVGGEEDMGAVLRLAQGGRPGAVRVHVHNATRSVSMARVRTQTESVSPSVHEISAFRRVPPGAFLTDHRQMSAASPTKRQWVVQKVSEMRRQGETPVVVYCEFMRALWLLKEALSGAVVVITGNTSSLQKDQARRAIRDGTADVVLISAAGGTGVDFRGVRHIIFASLPWSSAAYDQVAGRGAREGAHDHLPPLARSVTLWPLILDNPAPDHHLYRTILIKQEAARAALASVATPEGVARHLRAPHAPVNGYRGTK